MRSISCLGFGYILVQYMSSRHNLLYKTWIADLRRWRRRRLLKKKIIQAKYVKMAKCKYACIANTDEHCDLLQYRPIPLSGRMPHDKQNRRYLDFRQNLVMSPRGHQRQDGRTDGLTDCSQSCTKPRSVTLT